MKDTTFNFNELDNDVALSLLIRKRCNDVENQTLSQYSTLYYCPDTQCSKYHCAIYLGEEHGEHDMVCFKQFIKILAERQSFTTISLKDCENIWVFDLRYKDTITVDSTKTLIELGVKPKDASNLVCISHYTRIKNAIEILTNCGFYAKSLLHYGSEAKFNNSSEQKKTVFLASFTKEMNDVEEMWQNFGDNNKGCKIEFYFEQGLKDTFTPTRPLMCCNGKNLVGFIESKELRVKNYQEKANIMPDIFAELNFQLVDYEGLEENKSSMFITNENMDYAIVNQIGNSVRKSYSIQDEVRIKILLQSFYEKEIPFFDRIFLPYDIKKIKKIIVKIGKKAKTGNLDNIKRLADNKKIFIYTNDKED